MAGLLGAGGMPLIGRTTGRDEVMACCWCRLAQEGGACCCCCWGGGGCCGCACCGYWRETGCCWGMFGRTTTELIGTAACMGTGMAGR